MTIMGEDYDVLTVLSEHYNFVKKGHEKDF